MPHRNTAHRSLIEALEPRQLLSVDLQAAAGLDHLPATFIATTTAAGWVQVKVSNAGDTAAPAGEKATVSVVARPQGGGADVPLMTPRVLSVAGLKPTTGLRAWTLPVTFPATLPAGGYDIVATVTDTNDANTANDSATFSPTFTVQSAVVDLSTLSATTALRDTVAGGSHGSAIVTLKNLGNVPATGYTVTVYATSSGAIAPDSPIVGQVTPKARVAVNKTLRVAVPLTLPSPTTATDYILVAQVSIPADGNGSNDTASLKKVTVQATPPLLGNLPTTFGFTQTSSVVIPRVQVTTAGDISFSGGSTTGGTGYGYLVINKPSELKLGHLTLIVLNEGTVLVRLTFAGTRINSLDGKSITFQRSGVGATGSFAIPAAPDAGITKPVTGFFVVS